MGSKQHLVSRPRVRQRRRHRSSRAGVGVHHGQAQLGAACRRNERPDESDRAGDERRSGASPAERERLSFAAEAREQGQTARVVGLFEGATSSLGDSRRGKEPQLAAIPEVLWGAPAAPEALIETRIPGDRYAMIFTPM